MPDRPDIEQRGFGRDIDEDVEVTALLVLPMENGAEDTRIAGAVGLDDAADRGTVQLKCTGGLHGGVLRPGSFDAAEW